jgi:hypothetical protein
MKISITNDSLKSRAKFLYFKATPNKYGGFEKQQKLIIVSPN